MEDITKLIDKYFEGETSTQEENALRDYFSGKEIVPEHQAIAPLFTYLKEESIAMSVLNEIRAEEEISEKKRKSKTIRIQRWTMISAAASLLIGVFLLFSHYQSQQTWAKNYVWVDGEKITDMEVVKSYALSSFDNVKSENNILEEQLAFMSE